MVFLSFFCLVISKTCLNLAISWIKLLRNKREAQLKHMHKEISQFLQTGQEAIARIRVCLKFLYVYCICFPFWTCFSIYVGFLSFDGEYLTLVGLLGKLLGGACHTRTKHIGRLWYSRIVLRVYSCTYSYSWYPKVDTYVTYLFLYGAFCFYSLTGVFTNIIYIKFYPNMKTFRSKDQHKIIEYSFYL